MKKSIFYSLILVAAISCSSEEKKTGEESSTEAKNISTLTPPLPVPGDSVFISKDSANRMLSSYLVSIHAAQTDTAEASIIVDADSLRAYLSDTSIKNVKIMFAHQLDYINTGGFGRYAGYSHKALTVILAGYDNNGNYIYYNDNKVMDHGRPCPHHCPTSGTAASNTFPN